MKKTLLTFGAIAVVLAIVFLAACKKEGKPGADRALNASTLSLPTLTEIGLTGDTIVQAGDTLRLGACNTYLLHAKLYIDSAAVLIVENGVTVKGVPKASPELAAAVVITRYGKIHAVGTESSPITFTSAEASPVPGNWGGVVILGRATTNQANPRIEGFAATVPAGIDINYGGTTDNDDSGDFQFVRILYAGALVRSNDELNSLTLGGVGNGTDIHHVYTAFGADDGIEIFGGTVNASYLISRGINDDNFDFDFGYTGAIQYALSIADGSNTYNGDANGIECDNMGTCPNSATPKTHPQLTNFTFVSGTNTAVQAGTLYGVRFRRNTEFTLSNSVIMGYNPAANFDQTAGCVVSSTEFRDNILHTFGTTANIAIPGSNIVYNTGNSNDSIRLIRPFGTWCGNAITGFDGRPNSSTSPARSGANWPVGTPGFFTQVTYKGAFDPAASTARGWTAFACNVGCN